MLKNISNLGSPLNKKEQLSINGNGPSLEICNWLGDPIICKTGHCIQDSNGNWKCR